eukprot:Phypoly_transcript_14846.p1 GENE.Phypoly_transcript_14846~~Phypoly_transcript_14846.p1  ORF type:complete len:155 (+),score=39.46 Phypoly_transcript_14846:326-790(+)
MNCLEESFYNRVLDEDMPVNADNLETLQDARETICKYYFDKHAPVLAPLAQKINREVLQEIASGKLVIGEPDEQFISDLYDRRARQEEDPRIAETIRSEYSEREAIEDEEPSDAQMLIEDNWSQEELDQQKEKAFVKTTRKRDEPELRERDDRL